jgi:ubiquinone/menaquinone biosynthesis C-methylase UbiE
MEDFLRKATNPGQYDSENFDWQQSGLTDSPIRRYFQYYLAPKLEISGKSLIDIGWGMGSMVGLLEEKGAREIIGIDPSKNNIAVAQKNYPRQQFIVSTMENYLVERKFDVAVSIMVFEHIGDPQKMFTKIFSLLNGNGTFYLVTGDKGYNTTQRMGYEIEVQKVGEDIALTKTKRSWETSYDIFRSVSFFIECGKKAGFRLKEHLPLIPDDETIKMIPKYKDFKEVPIAHLFIFEK